MIKFSVDYSGQKEQNGWAHFLWYITINGEDFNYRMGFAHHTTEKPKGVKLPAFDYVKSIEDGRRIYPTPPKQDKVLNALFSDARCGQMSFYDFCGEFGYNEDSISALKIHFECMETGRKLKRALGKDYASEEKRIEALEL